MGDPRRRGIPERLLLPPAPAEPDLATRWGALPFDERHRLARVPEARIGDLPAHERDLVAGLARRRIATAWRPAVASVVLGWLVLMAVWGFGRSTFPQDAPSWFAVGLGLGLLTALAGLLGTGRRLHRARTLTAANGTEAEVPEEDTA